MLTAKQALSLVLSHCPPPRVESVALHESLGRVLAQPVRADRDSPPADRSAMDGYAVRAGDLAEVPCELELIGEVAAGSARRPRVRPGTCVRILTGGNVPPGADAVAIVESTEQVTATLVRFRAKVGPGKNILRQAENARKGEVLLDKGTRLAAQQIGVCASFGVDPVLVYARPRVGVLCTGSELSGVSSRVRRHMERNSNGPALRAAVQASGLALCSFTDVVDDDAQTLKAGVKKALKKCDILLLVGGVSVGKYDFVPEVLEALNCRKVFHRVRMKPGKPTLFAMGPGKQLVFGLPGNPLSAMTAFHEFVMPAMRKISAVAGPAIIAIHVRLQSPVTRKSGERTRYFPARVEFDRRHGVPVAVPIETHSSADVIAGGRCNGVLVLPPTKDQYEAGNFVEFHPWGTLL